MPIEKDLHPSVKDIELANHGRLSGKEQWSRNFFKMRLLELATAGFIAGAALGGTGMGEEVFATSPTQQIPSVNKSTEPLLIRNLPNTENSNTENPIPLINERTDYAVSFINPQIQQMLNDEVLPYVVAQNTGYIEQLETIKQSRQTKEPFIARLTYWDFIPDKDKTDGEKLLVAPTKEVDLSTLTLEIRSTYIEYTQTKTPLGMPGFEEIRFHVDDKDHGNRLIIEIDKPVKSDEDPALAFTGTLFESLMMLSQKNPYPHFQDEPDLYIRERLINTTNPEHWESRIFNGIMN